MSGPRRPAAIKLATPAALSSVSAVAGGLPEAAPLGRARALELGQPRLVEDRRDRSACGIAASAAAACGIPATTHPTRQRASVSSDTGEVGLA
ncbi:MAG: hypothetical protein IPG96_07985 [Proteobacteria bacterium]|nr:hypothetical protein [Pseudomonadota bacterium]